jgi:tetratricopeptide (TPR) repeat protein/O-antigen ligase
MPMFVNSQKMNKPDKPGSLLIPVATQLALFLFFFYVTFIGGQVALGIYDVTWRSITLYLAGALLAIWLLWRWLTGGNIPRTPLDWPLLFLLGVWVATSLFSSVTAVYSRETLVFYALYLLFYYAAADLGRRPRFVELTFNAIIAVSGVIWIFGLLQINMWVQQQTAAGAPVWPLPRLSVLGNPNTMGSSIVLVLPLLLYKLVTVRQWVIRLLLSGWLAILVLMLFFTRSRGAMLALFVAAFSLGGLWLLTVAQVRRFLRQNRVVGWILRHRWLLPLAGVAVLALVLLLLLQIQNAEDSLSVRGRMMRAGLLIWQQYPLFGSGLGTMGQLALQIWPPNSKMWPDAHNLFLTLGAETGLIGVGGLLWLLLAAGWWGWRYFTTIPPARWSLAGITCLASLLGFFTHNMVDYLIKYPGLMICVVILAGFWISLTSDPDVQPPRTAKSWGRPLTTVVMGGLLVTMAAGIHNLTHLRAYNQAVDAALRQDWGAATAHLESVNRLAPDMPFYQRELGLTAGYLAQSEPAYLPLAISSYRAAIEQVPWLPGDYANLACLLWQAGESGEALAVIRRAEQMYPTHRVYHATLISYLAETGAEQEVALESARLLANRAGLLKAATWIDTPARQLSLARALAELPPHPAHTPSQLEHWLAMENEAAVRVLVDSLRMQPDPDPVVLNLVEGVLAHARGDLAEAEAAFKAAQQAGPANGKAAYYLSRLYLEQGRLDEAAEAIELALNSWQPPEYLLLAGQVAEARDGLRRRWAPMIPPLQNWPTITPHLFWPGMPPRSPGDGQCRPPICPACSSFGTPISWSASPWLRDTCWRLSR